MSTKNTSTRNRLAAKIRELRTWPLVDSRLLRRPAFEEPLLTTPGAITLDELTERLRDAWSLDLEAIAEPVARVRPLGFGLDPKRVVLKAVEGAGLEGELVPSLHVCRLAKASDRQFANQVEALWGRYLQDSLACDDTDTQYQMFLRLKAIYEPVSEP